MRNEYWRFKNHQAQEVKVCSRRCGADQEEVQNRNEGARFWSLRQSLFIASSVADATFKVAIKVINKKKIEDDIDQILDEISILKELDHPNIIKYHETYENEKYMYIVMEYCSGGELFDVIAKRAQKEGSFNESEAADMMMKLLKAINHCHSQGVAHRDIKPENIMISEDGDLKLIDFGLSKLVKNKKMKTIVGTPYYIAPEVLQGKYGLK